MQDDVLPDGTAVKAGDIISYYPYGFARSEKLWPNPLKVFRLFNVLETHTHTHTHSSIRSVFSPIRSQHNTNIQRSTPAHAFASVRVCVCVCGACVCVYQAHCAAEGRGLALLEAKLVIASVYSKYVLRMKPDHPVHYRVRLCCVAFWRFCCACCCLSFCCEDCLAHVSCCLGDSCVVEYR